MKMWVSLFRSHFGWHCSSRTCWLRIVGVVFLGLLLGCRTQAPSSRSDKDAAQAVRDLLHEQAAMWNQGDLVGFMGAYVFTDELRFSSGGSSQRGWRTTLERYQARYPNRQAMGELSFEDLEVLVLSSEWAEAFGRYRLKRGGDYSDATGLFTLLLQRTMDGWRIVHDHTSAAEP